MSIDKAPHWPQIKPLASAMKKKPAQSSVTKPIPAGQPASASPSTRKARTEKRKEKARKQEEKTEKEVAELFFKHQLGFKNADYLLVLEWAMDKAVVRKPMWEETLRNATIHHYTKLAKGALLEPPRKDTSAKADERIANLKADGFLRCDVIEILRWIKEYLFCAGSDTRKAAAKKAIKKRWEQKTSGT